MAADERVRKWWTLDEVLAKFGFTRAELQAEMDAEAVESDTSANARPDTPDDGSDWPEATP